MTNYIEASKQYIEDLLSTPSQAATCSLPEAVILDMARANHEAWCAGKKADGYTYGESVDDVQRTSNLLVDFDQLPEDIKADNVRNARQSVSLIIAAGCTIGGTPATDEQIAEKVEVIVEALHDDWAAGKARKGYTYAESRNDDPAKGALTHRDMLPFALLMQLHPEDADYDRQTALGAISAVRAAGYVIGIATK